MYSERSGWLWVRILPHLPSVWVTPIWYRNLIVVAPPSLSKSMFWRRMWQKMEISYHIHKFIVTYIYFWYLKDDKFKNLFLWKVYWVDYFERNCIPSIINNLTYKHLNLQNKNVASCKRIYTHVCILSVCITRCDIAACVPIHLLHQFEYIVEVPLSS